MHKKVFFLLKIGDLKNQIVTYILTDCGYFANDLGICYKFSSVLEVNVNE